MEAGARKRLLLILGAAVLLAAGGGLFYVGSVAPVAAGYYAKVMCSGVFVSGRTPEALRAEDLALDHPFLRLMSADVDQGARVVTARFAGLFQRQALYRDGLGCTLDTGTSPDSLRAQAAGYEAPRLPEEAAALAWPAGDGEPPGDAAAFDESKLSAALDDAFLEPDPERPRRTRAVVGVHAGRLVADRYAEGFGRDMPLAGWSMTKSVTGALVGVLAGAGKLSVEQPAPVSEWEPADDLRRAITLGDLLHMSSGLEFNEDYFDLTADAPRMLFRAPSAGAYAAAKPLAHEPGSHWAYSSGTSNIVSRVIRETVGGHLDDYWSFPQHALFHRIGARSFVLEPDPSGVFVGSSFCYATARDWARLGLLFLNGGLAGEERILPEGWTEYAATPAPRAPRGRYGAHVWLNAGDPGNPARRRWPDLPADLVMFNGFEGQHVVISPGLDLVVVRLGQSPGTGSTWNLKKFLEQLIPAFPARPPEG